MANSLKEFKKQTIDAAEERINEMQEEGDIDVPEDYSVGNSLRAAWLELQSITDKKDQPVVMSCERSSVVNAMLETVIMGLNPSKDQVYYIPYGKQLTAMPSYFGYISMAKRMGNVKDVTAEVIYDGDDLQIIVENGQRKVAGHETSWDNMSKEIAGGYAIATFADDRPDKHTIMTLEECQSAWEQGRTYKGMDGDSPHAEFTAEMVKKTVVKRLLKPIIKSSTDSYLFGKALDSSLDLQAEMDRDEDIEEKQATETIDITPEEETAKNGPQETTEGFEEEAQEVLDEEEEPPAPF